MIRDSVNDWQELSALYERADALDEAGLTAWMSELQAESHRLLPQLTRMLEARTRVAERDFLGTLPALGVPARHDEFEWREGSRFGAYRLVRHIGSGGMAEVWLADRVDGAFDRQVAMKLLLSHPARTQRTALAERFGRERKILASLDHPNIARLCDAGVMPGGQPWLALEHIRGEAITTWCDAKCLDIAGRIGVFVQVLHAVEYAHASLVMHRDLKPSNIFVTDDGTVKLLDFGIAKLLETAEIASTDTDLTLESGRPLTPQYASPEQLARRALTTSSDVYSLGVVLYELLCGQRPYDVRVDFASGIDLALFDHEPTAPSRTAMTEAEAAKRAATAQQVRSMLSSDLDAVALKALAVSPADRYASVAALRGDLERWSRGDPVLAKPSTPAYRFRKFVKRHSTAVISGTGAAVVLLAVAAVALAMGWKANREADRAVAARDFMLGVLRVADPDKVGDTSPAAQEILLTAAERAATDLRSQPDLLATVLESLGQMQLNQGLLTVADKTFEKLTGLYEGQGKKREWIVAQSRRAHTSLRLGDYRRARELIDRAAFAAAPYPEDDELQAEIYLVRGVTEQRSGDPAAAREDMRHAVDRSTRAYGKNDYRTIDATSALVDVEGESRDYGAALEVIDRAIASARDDPKVHPITKLEISLSRARILMKAGRYGAALALADVLGPDCDRIAGTSRISCVLLLNLRAVVLSRLEQRDEALRLVDDLSNASENTLNPGQQRGSLLNLARVLSGSNAWSLKPRAREALVGLAADTSAPVTERASAQSILTEDLLLRGLTDKAYQIAVESLEIQRTVPHSPWMLGMAKLHFGLVLQARGEDAAALEAFGDADRALAEELGDEHPLVALYRMNQVPSLQRLGRRKAAVELARNASQRLRVAFGDAAPVVVRIEKLRAQLAQSPPASLYKTGAIPFFI